MHKKEHVGSTNDELHTHVLEEITFAKSPPGVPEEVIHGALLKQIPEDGAYDKLRTNVFGGATYAKLFTAVPA